MSNVTLLEPAFCANMTSLSLVSLSDNPLGALPQSLATLPALRQLCAARAPPRRLLPPASLPAPR